jgi:arsenical pump membrane protein
VEALVATGAIGELQSFLVASSGSTDSLSWTAGIGIALISNLVNNLPAALVAGTASHGVSGQPALREALLIGVDLGPNLSVTGSLATILWLQAMRRAGVEMTAGRFLKVGTVVMPPALLLSLTALLVVR